MTRTAILLSVLVAGLSTLAAPLARASEPVATIARLSGQVMVLKPDGRPRILATASRVAAGDTLVSEDGSYVQVALENGHQLVLGPSTTLKVARATAQETALVLVGGQVQVTGAPQPTGHRFTVAAGASTIAAGTASFTAAYSAPVDAVALRQAWLRSSLAAIRSNATDGPDDLPLREVIAQGLAPAPPRPPTGALAPGLHVFVLDGLIQMSNAGGSQSFSAGQFGYVRNNISPPIVVPANPGLKFTPPPTFSLVNTNPNSNQPKPDAVDCEVR